METYIDRKKMQLMAATLRQSCKTFKKRRDWFIRVKVPDTHLKECFQTHLDFPNHRNQFPIEPPKAEAYQIAIEGDNESNYHIQAVVRFQQGTHKNDVLIKQSIKTFFSNFKESFQARGIKIPNTYYSCVRIRENAIRALAYNYKEDSQPIEKNIDPRDVALAKKLSHGKDLRQLSKRLETIKEDYYTNKITAYTLTCKILALKADFNQSIYVNRIEAEVRYIMIRHHPEYAKLWASEIVDKITGN